MKFLAPLACLALCLAGCEKDDLGSSCVGETAASGTTDVNPSDNEINSPASVRKDGKCETFLCVSTLARSDYCSKECVSNRNCPEGFECAQLQPVGPLAESRYCLLAKTCRPNVTGDCPKGRFKCREFATSVPDQPVYYCDVLNEGESAD